MPDITMCKNHDCPVADKCWRYGCPPKEKGQSYQVFEPQKDNEEEFECDGFIEYLVFN